MTRRRRHHSPVMKQRGKARTYKQRVWVRIFDGDWNLAASSRTARRGGGTLPHPNEIGAFNA